MASYYTRAKARSEVESEDLEPSDSASVTTTTIASSIPIGLQVESTGEFESMATEIAGPVATHPQLPPEGGHPSVGGHGVTGSANSPLVGVSTLGYPSGPADPPDSAMTSVTDTLTTAEATAITTTGSSNTVSSRQPPTVTADTTAAAFQSPTHVVIFHTSKLHLSGTMFKRIFDDFLFDSRM